MRQVRTGTALDALLGGVTARGYLVGLGTLFGDVLAGLDLVRFNPLFVDVGARGDGTFSTCSSETISQVRTWWAHALFRNVLAGLDLIRLDVLFGRVLTGLDLEGLDAFLGHVAAGGHGIDSTRSSET